MIEERHKNSKMIITIKVLSKRIFVPNEFEKVKHPIKFSAPNEQEAIFLDYVSCIRF